MDEMNSEAISMQEVIDSLTAESPEQESPEQESQAAEPEQAKPESNAQEAPEQEAEDRQDASSVSDEQVEAVRTLLADGWTRDELMAFSQDETAQKDMAGGRSMRQAALSYLRRQSAPRSEEGGRKRGAPIARNTSSGGSAEVDIIRNMSDAQYEKFMADMRRRAMRGEKIRI